jgi:hypothetical protein
MIVGTTTRSAFPRIFRVWNMFGPSGDPPLGVIIFGVLQLSSYLGV